MTSQGITIQGMDSLGFLGISECGSATRNSTDILAEVTDSLLKMSCKCSPTQMIVDNLDFLREHMTIDYKEVERINTSDLSDIGMDSREIPNLFDKKEIMIEDPKHEEELKHVESLFANSVGRLLAKRLEKVQC